MTVFYWIRERRAVAVKQGLVEGFLTTGAKRSGVVTVTRLKTCLTLKFYFFSIFAHFIL